nr:hypothetical protein [Lysobacter sp.]
TTVMLDVLHATGGAVTAKGADAARIQRALQIIAANAERMREDVRAGRGKRSRA